MKTFVFYFVPSNLREQKKGKKFLEKVVLGVIIGIISKLFIILFERFFLSWYNFSKIFKDWFNDQSFFIPKSHTKTPENNIFNWKYFDPRKNLIALKCLKSIIWKNKSEIKIHKIPKTKAWNISDRYIHLKEIKG